MPGIDGVIVYVLSVSMLTGSFLLINISSPHAQYKCAAIVEGPQYQPMRAIWQSHREAKSERTHSVPQIEIVTGGANNSPTDNTTRPYSTME